MNSLPRTSGIYKIVCVPTGKVYIGSATNIYFRIHSHLSLLRNNQHSNSHLQASWNKYKECSFELKEIELVLIPFLAEREQYYIDKLKTMDRAKGFNIFSADRTDVSRRKKRAAFTLEHCANISAGKRGIRTVSTKMKSRKGHGKAFIITSRDGTEMEIRNLREFCRKNDLDYDSMRAVARGRKSEYKGWGCKKP